MFYKGIKPKSQLENVSRCSKKESEEVEEVEEVEQVQSHFTPLKPSLIR